MLLIGNLSHKCWSHYLKHYSQCELLEMCCINNFDLKSSVLFSSFNVMLKTINDYYKYKNMHLCLIFIYPKNSPSLRCVWFKPVQLDSINNLLVDCRCQFCLQDWPNTKLKENLSIYFSAFGQVFVIQFPPLSKEATVLPSCDVQVHCVPRSETRFGCGQKVHVQNQPETEPVQEQGHWCYRGGSTEHHKGRHRLLPVHGQLQWEVGTPFSTCCTSCLFNNFPDKDCILLWVQPLCSPDQGLG